MISAWIELGLQTARLAWHTQTDVALRMMRLTVVEAPDKASEPPPVWEEPDADTAAEPAAASIAISDSNDRKVKKGVGRKRPKRAASPPSATQ